MALTRRDLAATVVAALVLLVYAANVEGWGFLAGNRWAAGTMLAIGAVGCSAGARLQGERASAPLVFLGALGTASLVLGILAVATGAQWALLGLAVVLLALWVGTTLRHALAPSPRTVVQ